ncbi:GFA family protein [Archangium gephyra]|uniref:GFA family protein n=1 Tax=Archangium gephyra TaxID=48 RepID=UPI003B7F2F2A
MPVPFTGGCACGAIRYECSAAPIAVLNCHCRNCQRASGTGHSTVAVVPADSLRLLHGTPRSHASTADSGNETRREFCAGCGSPLFARGGIPSFVAITAGSLDDPSGCVPTIDIWTQSAQPWDTMNPSLPKFPKNIPAPSR